MLLIILIFDVQRSYCVQYKNRIVHRCRRDENNDLTRARLGSEVRVYRATVRECERREKIYNIIIIAVSAPPIHTTDRLCLLTDINNTLYSTHAHAQAHTHRHTHTRARTQHWRRRRGTTTGGTLVQSKHFENGIVDDTVEGRRRGDGGGGAAVVETRAAETSAERRLRVGGVMCRGPSVQLVCTGGETAAVEGLFI